MKLRTIFALLVVVICGVHSPNSFAADLREQLEPLVTAHRGEVAVAIKNLDTGESYEHRASAVQPTASLIKFPIMAAAYHAFEEGRLDPDQKITLSAEDKVPGSGILTQHFSDGVVITLRDAIRLMITYSDNTATNLVLDRVGMKETNAYLESLGLQETRIHSKVYRRDTSILPERSEKYGLGSTSPAEMIKLCELLHAHQLGNEASEKAMRAHLESCDDKTKIVRHLPSAVKVAHKTGAVNKVRTDAGLMPTPKGTVAFCVMTNENADTSWGDKNEAELLCAEIGRIVYEHFAGKEAKQVAAVRELKIGASGSLVEALQRTLNAQMKDGTKLMVDGDFGPNTESAVVAFQKQVGVEPSGIVDRPTWDKLGPLVPKDAPQPEQATAPVRPRETPQQEQLTGPPVVTCPAWVIADGETGDVLFAQQPDLAREPASTTKIMTALLVVELAEQDEKVLDELVTFSQNADETPGSTAAVEAGEQVSVRDLLYGLLLPSGNDASVAFGEHFGTRLASKSATPQTNAEPKNEANDDLSVRKQAYVGFVAAMNAKAKALGMRETHFDNTHGLSVRTHQTTARDLAILAIAAWKHPLFRKVVGTSEYACELGSEVGYRRKATWQNTNQLLGFVEYEGIKTGTTGPAGACLVSRGTRDDRSLVVVVLGSAASESRYADSRNLYRWAWKELGCE